MALQISKEFIEEVVARHDIYNTLSAYIKLKKTGTNFSALCPFHQEKTPSFSVNPHKQFYHCFGCGASGNVISFIMQFENATFIEALDLLATQVGMQIPKQSAAIQDNHREHYAILQKAAEFYQQQWQDPRSEKAKTYLKNRGLSGQTAKQFCMGYAPPGWDNLLRHFKHDPKALPLLVSTGMIIEKDGKNYDRFRDRILFPIRDRRGRVIGFGGRVLNDETPKYLNSPETPIFHKGQELYGLYEALKVNHPLSTCVLVEGYMDVIALAEHGINIAAATLGTATTSQHLRMILRYTQDLVFCFDGDNAGKKAAIRAMETALPLLSEGIQIRILFLPQGEDPDSLVRVEGKEAFLNRLVSAKPLSVVLFEHLQADIDLSTVEGKAALVETALPLIALIPSQALKTVYLDQLSRFTRISPERLEKNLLQVAKKMAKTPNMPLTQKAAAEPAQQKPRTLSANSRKMITILVHYPAILLRESFQQFHSLITNNNDTLLAEIGRSILQSAIESTGHLIEVWRQSVDFPTILNIAKQESLLSESEAEQELIALLQTGAVQGMQHKVRLLLEKANAGTISPSERLELQTLIKEKHRNSSN